MFYTKGDFSRRKSHYNVNFTSFKEGSVSKIVASESEKINNFAKAKKIFFCGEVASGTAIKFTVDISSEQMVI